MSLARAFTERVATALLSFVALGMALGGVALAGLGLTLGQTGFEMEGMSIITAGLTALGAVLALSGGIAVVWARGAGYSALRLDVAPGPALFLGAFAAALPLAVMKQLGGLAAYWRDIGRLAAEYNVWESANGPTALVFVPAAGVLLVPALEALAAGAMVASCAVLLVLVVARGAAALKLSAIGALLAGGLVAGSWVGVGATERLAPSVETLIRTTARPGDLEQGRALALLQRHRAVAVESVWTLSWAWAGTALLALGTRAATAAIPDRTARFSRGFHFCIAASLVRSPWCRVRPWS